MQQHANEQMQNLADKALAELRKDPLHPEKAPKPSARRFRIRADNLQAGDPIPGIGVSKEFSDAVRASAQR